MSRWLVQSHPCHRIRRKIVETSEPIRPEYRSDVPMGGGLKRWKSANYAKTLSRELSGAVTAQNLETVESGRRWNGGRVASRRKGRYWGALAHVYEIRAARWYPPAFGYAFDLTIGVLAVIWTIGSTAWTAHWANTITLL